MHRTREQNDGLSGAGAKCGDIGQRIQMFNDKMNNCWGLNVYHGDHR